jgi:hypothetical protein
MSHNTRGLKILVTANDDPEFDIYIRNLIKEYFDGIDQSKIDNAFEKLLSDGKPNAFVNRIESSVDQAIERLLPYSYYSTSDTKRIQGELNSKIDEAVDRRVAKILESYTDDYIRVLIDNVIKARAEKAYSKTVNEMVSKTVKEMMGVE